MSLEDRKVNSLLREKILSLDSSDLRIQFFRPDEGMKIYHVGEAWSWIWRKKQMLCIRWVDAA